MPRPWQHPRFSRRVAVEAGFTSLLGLGMNHLAALRGAEAAPSQPRARSVIYIFLSGGLAQQDSFDPKPAAPENIRGDFRPIDTATPGISICEHLPRLAERSQDWALVRSLTHPYNEHSQGHMVMLSGRTPMPPAFSPNTPQPNDWPSLAAVAGELLRGQVERGQTNLPPAVVLPEKLIHRTGRVIPGQFAGEMGPRRDPWFVLASPFNATSYGAFPEFEFDHQNGAKRNQALAFQAPNLALPEGLLDARLARRFSLLAEVERQRQDLDRAAAGEAFDRHRQQAVSLLTDPRVREAFDVTRAADEVQKKYGRNAFGWSLLMARRLTAAGVPLVQVNLGNNETWDTHGNAFPHLKDYLLPPLDRGLSALIDDLRASGELDDTLLVMAGEFGRTPKVFGLPQHYKLPGRDHWGAVQTVFFCGGGVRGGRVVGSSDPTGGYPASDPQTPENFAATIYQSLGIPAEASWRDDLDRPHQVYHGEPIRGLS